MNARNDALGLAERTRKNLSHIENAYAEGADVHVITQLANSLLGLIVFPWERHFAQQVAQVSLTVLEGDGWPMWEITQGYANSLGQLIRCLRNGIAHGHMTFSSDSRLLAEVVVQVQDYHPSATESYWTAKISAANLREFCYRFIDLIDQRIG